MNTEEILAKELPDFVGNKTANDISLNDMIQALNKAVSNVQETIRVLYYINEGFNIIDKEKMTETLLTLGEFNTVIDNRVRKNHK